MTAPDFQLLASLSEITVGHVGPMAAQYVERGVPFLRSQNVKPFRLDLTDVKFVSPEFHIRLQKSALQPGDVVVVRTGTPGVAAVVPDYLPVANCADLVVIRPGPNLVARYLAYYINGAARGYVASRLVGAVQQHFNIGEARQLKIPLPELPEQHAIADVLGSLDDKIDAENRIASLCEALATAHVESVSLRVPLREFADLVRDQARPQDFAASKVALFSLPAFDAGRLPERCLGETIKSSKFVVSSPAVLISKLNPHIPRVWCAIPPTGMMSLSSTEFVVLRPQLPWSAELLWAACATLSFATALAEKVTGTTGSHQRVRPEEVLTAPVADLAALDDSVRTVVEVLVKRAAASREETIRLAALRESLLSPLLNGDLQVREAEPNVLEAL